MNQTGLKPATLAELRRSRELTVPGPSGHVYRIRPINLRRHALAGGFPERLRHIAVKQAIGESAIRSVDDVEELLAAAADVQAYTDAIVRQVIVEPSLDEPKEGEEDPLELLPAVDYDWAVGVAMGSVTTDGAGHNLWGEDRLARFRGTSSE